MSNERGSWSLVGLIAAMAIIVIAAALYFKGASPTTVKQDSDLLDPNSTKTTVIGKSMDTAKAMECKNQIDQIRQSINIYKQDSDTGENPATLADLNLGGGASFYKCPVSGLDYIYDPGTGQVGCPTHTNH